MDEAVVGFGDGFGIVAGDVLTERLGVDAAAGGLAAASEALRVLEDVVGEGDGGFHTGSITAATVLGSLPRLLVVSSHQTSVPSRTDSLSAPLMECGSSTTMRSLPSPVFLPSTAVAIPSCRRRAARLVSSGESKKARPEGRAGRDRVCWRLV